MLDQLTETHISLMAKNTKPKTKKQQQNHWEENTQIFPHIMEKTKINPADHGRTTEITHHVTENKQKDLPDRRKQP